MLTPVETLAPTDVNLPPMAIRGLSLIQPGVLVIVAVFIGSALAQRVSLDAPALRAAAQGDASAALGILQRQSGPAIVVAAIVGLLLAGYAAVTEPYFLSLDGPEVERMLAVTPPMITKILYGGLSEEIICRWGLMTFVAWLLWRLSGAPAAPAPWVLWSAIVVAAILFGLGHLPVLYGVVGQPPAWLVGAVVIANLAPGLAFGWLYWRFGLESAVLAHGSAHLVGGLASMVVSNSS